MFIYKIKNYKIKNLSKTFGFTMLELLIVLGITATLSVVGVGFYANQQKIKPLDNAAQEIVSYLHYAQQKSVAQEQGLQWGVHFENPTSGSDFYALYTGTTYTTPIETKYLSAGIEFQTPASSNSVDVSYEKLTGFLSGVSYKQIVLINSSGLTRNILTCQQGIITYNVDVSTCAGIDTTPPTVSSITASNYSYGSYVSSPFNLSANISDAESGVSSCEYTINNGTNWYSAAVSGSGPDFTCTKTGITSSNGASLTLNMRATSKGGTGTGTSITRTVDALAPTCSDNWTDNWTTTSPVTVTITPSDGSGSGISTTKYCVSTADTCTPTTVGTSASVTCASGSACTQYVRYAAWDNVNNASSISSKRVRQDKENPTASDNWTDNWTATSPVTVTITPSDGSGSGIQTTYYCVDTVNTCTPTTVGTAPSVSCASGSICTQYVRYYTKDNVNNISSTYSKRVRQDLQIPTASDNWTDNWTATTPVTVTITPSDGSGSGIQTTYYCVDTVNTCTPTTVGTAPSVSCASGSVCTQYVRYYTKDNVNNVSSTYSKRVRQDKENPTASDNWTDNWTATSPVTVTITPSDGAGSGISTTKYCVDTTNTCDPSTGTTGTSASITCASGSACTQYVRYAAWDNAGNASAIYSKRVRQDLQIPTASDNWTDNWTATTPVTVTITPSDGSGSGIQTTYYCVDTVNTCTPTTVGTAPSVSCASGSICTQYIRYYTKDNVNNVSSTYSKRVRQDLQIPTASDNWTDSWTATSPVTVTITPSDGSGSGIQTTYYCVDTNNSCTPTTVGTSASVTCASGSTCTQYARYYTKDNVNNISSTYSKTVRQDLQGPTDGTLTATPGNTQVSLSWTAASDSGSGLATPNTYKVVYLTSGYPAANCTSGTQIYLGTGTSYPHTGLTNGTPYYYRTCAYDTLSNVSTGATASATPVAPCSCGDWSACGSCSYATTCATSGTGTQTRTCTPSGCLTESQSCTCTRSTDGANCGTCKKCSSGSCINELSTEDLFNQCGSDATCCGHCSGSGSCTYVPRSNQCSAVGSLTKCSGKCSPEDVSTCDGSGTCGCGY